MNSLKIRRIQAGLAAINAHIAAKNKELIGPRNGSPVIDLLADLMHYCAAAEVDFDEQLRLCRVHFHAEKEDGMTSKTETDNRMWQAGYDAGFEDGRRQAVQAMRALWKRALDAKIDALAEPISRGTP